MTESGATPQYVVILNFILFQLTWFICVLGAAYERPWLAFTIVFCLVIAQLFTAKAPSKEIVLILMVTTIGASFDQVLLNHHLLAYQAHGWSQAIVPIWIISLWIAFASSLNLSLRWLRKTLFAPVLLGGIGGPLAYFGAEKLGAVTLVNQSVSLIVLALGWASLTPFLVNLAKRFDGY